MSQSDKNYSRNMALEEAALIVEKPLLTNGIWRRADELRAAEIRALKLIGDAPSAPSSTSFTTSPTIISDLAYVEGFLSEAAQDFGPVWVEVHKKVKAALEHLSLTPSATASASPRVKCDYPRCGRAESRCGVCDYKGEPK